MQQLAEEWAIAKDRRQESPTLVARRQSLQDGWSIGGSLESQARKPGIAGQGQAGGGRQVEGRGHVPRPWLAADC